MDLIEILFIFFINCLMCLSGLEIEESLQNNTLCKYINCWNLFLERLLLAWTFCFCIQTLNNDFIKWKAKCCKSFIRIWKHPKDSNFKHTHALQKRVSKRIRKKLKLFSQNCKYIQRVTIWAFAVPFDGLDQYDELQTYDGRLKTYQGFSAVSQEHARILAQNGFLFTGLREEVECFSCRSRHNVNTMNDQENLSKLHSQTCQHRIQYGQMRAISHQIPQQHIGQSHSDDHEIAGTTQLNTLQIKQEEAYECGKRFPNGLAESRTESNLSTSSNERLYVVLYERVIEQPCRLETQQHESHSSENIKDECTKTPVDMSHAGAYNKVPGNRASYRKLSENNGSVENRTTTNVPVENTNIIHRVNYSSCQNRSQSFQNWPKTSICNPDELAEAGFFYKGNGDNVKCFCCGGEVRNWKRNMDPWKEHKDLYPHCTFLAEQNKGRFQRQKDQDCVLSRRIQAGLEPIITEELIEQQGANAMESGTNFGQPTQTKSIICRMCRYRKSNVLFEPCMHVICCDICAPAIKKCMCCHMRIKSKGKVYM